MIFPNFPPFHGLSTTGIPLPSVDSLFSFLARFWHFGNVDYAGHKAILEGSCFTMLWDPKKWGIGPSLPIRIQANLDMHGERRFSGMLETLLPYSLALWLAHSLAQDARSMRDLFTQKAVDSKEPLKCYFTCIVMGSEQLPRRQLCCS
nr:hypothetical protein Iba_chr06aCG16720 [Ipomoea batatas]